MRCDLAIGIQPPHQARHFSQRLIHICPQSRQLIAFRGEEAGLHTRGNLAGADAVENAVERPDAALVAAIQEDEEQCADDTKTQDGPYKDRHIILNQSLPRRQPAADEQEKPIIDSFYPREHGPLAQAKLGSVHFGPSLFQGRLRGPGRCISGNNTPIRPDEHVDGLCILTAIIEQALAKQPAGILLHPMNPDPFVEPINRATEAGTAVVTFAADSPNSKRVSYVTSDNAREGRVAAQQVAEDMGGSGQYAVLENPGQDNHDRRVAAFIEEMDENYPDMELVGRASTGQDPNKAYQAVLSLAQANPELGAVFMPEASSAMGAAQAAKEAGGDIRVMSVDVNASVLDMIQAGEMFGAINPNQGTQGYYGFLLLWLAKHPELIDPMNDHAEAGFNPMGIPVLDNGYSVVTQDNAESFYWDKYLKKRGTRGIEG